MRSFAALAVLLALSASAPAQPWPATNWTLVQSGPLGGTEAVPEQDTPGTSLHAVRAELNGASAWLAGLGFRAPRLGLATDGRYPAFLVPGRSLNSVGADGERQTVVGDYVAPAGNPPGLAGRRLNLNRDELTRPSFYRDGAVQGSGADLTLNHETLATPVHELFHAVQASYPVGATPSALWITEGTAEAVMHTWQRRRGYPFSMSAGEYDVRSLTDGAYDRAHFWYALAADAGGIAYLDRFYATALARESGEGAGVEWLDRNLRTARLGGLRRYLAYFTTRHLRDAAQFASEAEVSIGADGAATMRVSQQKPLTVAALRVRFPRPPELGRLDVTIEDAPPSATIVIGGEAFDGERASVETTDEVCGTGAMCEVPVRIVNAADDPVNTPQIAYTASFELVAGCDFRYPPGVYGVGYMISMPGQPPKYFGIKFPGAGARGRQPVSGPFEAAYLETAASGLGRTTMTGEMTCTGGALDVGGLTTAFSGTPIARERAATAEASGRWALPGRPTVGQKLPDVVSEVDIAIEGDRGFSATTRTFDQEIEGRERVPLESPDARLDPHLRRGVSTWKVIGKTSGQGFLHEDAFMGEMDRTMEEMGVELDDATRGMIETMMGGLLGAAQAGQPEAAEPFTLWYSLDFGLVKMVTGSTTIELIKTYREDE